MSCTSVAGPHAVSVIGAKSYCYDANGRAGLSRGTAARRRTPAQGSAGRTAEQGQRSNNTEVRSGGAVLRSIVYTGYDLPERIVRSEFGINETAEFRYGPDRARYKRCTAPA